MEITLAAKLMFRGWLGQDTMGTLRFSPRSSHITFDSVRTTPRQVNPKAHMAGLAALAIPQGQVTALSDVSGFRSGFPQHTNTFCSSFFPLNKGFMDKFRHALVVLFHAMCVFICFVHTDCQSFF